MPDAVRIVFPVALALAATVLTYGQTPSFPQQTPQPAPPITLTGRVVEADGKTPIGSAVVAINGGPDHSDRTISDAAGRFFFPAVARNAAYLVTVNKPGYLTGGYRQYRPAGRQSSLNLVEEAPPGEITLKLWRGAVLTGRVVDDAGEPMVDVPVRAVRLQFLAGRRQLAETTKLRTDDRGMYRFASMRPGTYVIALVATVTSEPATYSGAIRLEGDLPHAFLQTMTGIGTAPLVQYDPVTGVTGAPGIVASSALGSMSVPPAQGEWMTYPTTYLPGATTLSTARLIEAVSGQVQTLPDVQVHLKPTFHVSGQLVGPDGPAAYHAVHLVASDSADAPLFDASTAVTDAAGQFTFYGVTPGQYVARVVKSTWPTTGRGLVVASRGGGSDAWISTTGRGGLTPLPTEPLLSATQGVTVGERDLSGLMLNLKPGPRVTGRSEFIGSTPPPPPDVIANMILRLEPASGQTFAVVPPGRFDETGKFATPGNWPTRYLVRGNGTGAWTLARATSQGHDLSETPFDLTSDLDDVVLTFTDHVSQITGTIDRTDADAGADVILFTIDPTGWVDYGGASSRRVTITPCSPTGSFTLRAPPAGDYYLVAIPDEEAGNWQDPKFLERVAPLADRVTVTDNQSLERALHVRRVS